MTHALAGAARLVAVLALLAGCGDDRRLVIVLHGEVQAETVRVEAVVLRPGPASACSDVLAETDHLEFPDAVLRADFDPASPPGLGHLGEGRFLMLVRAWSRECRLAQGCQEFEVIDGVEDAVRIDLRQFLDIRSSCPEATQCDDGLCTRCRDCCRETQCNDLDPTTTDACIAGLCEASDDLDRDGFPVADDCDDRRQEVRPGALAACGHALDTDCDGVIDGLDGCETPDCWLGTVLGIAPQPLLRAYAVAPAGGLVAAALADATGGTTLWLGRLADGALEEVAAVPLAGTVGFAPVDLVVLDHSAFVVSSDMTSISVVDLSVAEAPVQLPSIALASGPVRATRSLTLAPPLLWAARTGGLDVFDAAQVGPEDGWPAPLAEAVDPVNAATAELLLVRSGTAYLLSGLGQVSCAPIESTVAVPEGFAPCFSTTSVPTLGAAVFSVGHVTAGRELFLASNHDALTDTPPLLWRLSLDEAGMPSSTDVRVTQVIGASEHLVVAGGTIFRATDRGLFLHPRADFDRATEPRWAEVDTLDADPATPGLAVLETVVIGTSAVIAGGDSGLAVISLECREGDL